MKCGRLVRSACLASVVAVVGLAVPATAGEAEIVAVEAMPEAAGTWRFSVTLRHADAGWDHYADAWQILDPAGAVLGERELLHPHDDEQPFTRSLGGVSIPDGIETVEVRARDNVHGWGPAVTHTLREKM